MLDKVANRVAESVSAWRSASLQPLELPLFRALWLAAMASNFGAVIQTVGASWTMTTLDPSPHMVALVQTAAMAPIVLLALPAGALADNADRRTLMLISQALGFLAASLLAGFAFAGLLNPWLLLAGTALVGGAMALHTPAWQASFADLVPRASLPAAIGLNSLAFNVARSLGPAIGGLVLALAGAAAAFTLNAVSFLGLIAVLALNKLPRAPAHLPPEPVGQAMLAGLRYVAMSPVLKTTLLRGGLFAFGGSALFSLAPLIAQIRLGGGPVDYGLLLGAFGLGSLLAAASSAYVLGQLGNNRMLTLCTVAFSSATLVVALSAWLPLSLVFMGVAGAGWIFAFTTTTTCIQLSSPRWVVGRAVALSQVAIIGSMAFGAAFWGFLAAHSTLVACLVAAAGFLAISLVASWLAPLPGVGFDDLSPHPRPDVPAPRVAMQGTTGPVFVLIEYEVPSEQREEFLRTMYELGHIRRRDGARRWSIQQDIDDPDIWLERIESATWTDHLRRAARITVTDQAVRARAEIFRANRPIRRTVERPQGSAPLD